MKPHFLYRCGEMRALSHPSTSTTTSSPTWPRPTRLPQNLLSRPSPIPIPPAERSSRSQPLFFPSRPFSAYPKIHRNGQGIRLAISRRHDHIRNQNDQVRTQSVCEALQYQDAFCVGPVVQDAAEVICFCSYDSSPVNRLHDATRKARSQMEKENEP